MDFAPRIIEYDRQRFDFASTVRLMLEQQHLDRLHGDEYGQFVRETDQSTVFHKLFYDCFPAMMGRAYREFVAQMVPMIFGDTEVYYQAVPTLRVQLVGNVAVGEWHTDRAYGHQDGTLNFWVPLTFAFGSNTVWVEHDHGARSYRAWEARPGQVLVFDGVNWSHGNIRNDTGRSRVSFDFRVIPVDKYVDTGAVSVSAGRRMCVGDYWEKF